MEKIREQTRQRVARHRAKPKDVTLLVTQGNAADTETEIEPEKQQQEIRLLLNDTPLCRITDQELRSLAERHGGKPLMLASDIAAETWRREKKEIPNPGGYLQSLCSSLVVPSWYQTTDERKAKAEAAEKQRFASRKAQEEKKAAEEKEAQAREEYWASISEAERSGFRLEAKETTKSGFELPGAAIAAMAKILAWESRSQMNTQEHLVPR